MGGGMKKHQNTSVDSRELRRRAEARLREKKESQRSEAGGQRTEEETERLIHELEVHQIELEMQNEELLRACAVESLRKNETLLSEMTNQVPGVVYQFYARPNGEIGFYYVSEMSERIIGIKPDLDGYFERFTALVIPEYRQGFIQSIEKSVMESSAWSYEGKLQKTSGEKIWFSGNSTPSPRENEMIFDGIVQDITERKRMEEALRESENKFSRLSDATWEGIIIHREGMIIDANQSVAKMLGYPTEEVIGRNLINFIAPESIESTLQKLREGTTHDQLYLEVKVVRKDQTIFSAEALGKPIRYNNIDARVLAIRDITERKRAEAALRESEQQLRLITENMHDTVWLMDLSFRTTWISPSVVRARGYSLEELAELPLDQQLTAESLSRMYDLASVNLTPEKLTDPLCEIMVSGEFEYYRKNGSTFWADSVVTLLRDNDGSPRMLLVVGRDITERKQAEEVRIEMERRLQHGQRLESLGVLAGGIAHDFNNILAAILGYAEMSSEKLESALPNSTVLSHLSQIRSGCKRATELVQQILAFSRSADSQHVAIDLALMTKETMKLLRATIPSSIKIIQAFEGDGGEVLLNPAKFQQILMNLCINSSHAMRESGGVLTVRLGRADLGAKGQENPSGNYVRISVSDTGCGISLENMSRIFDPFFTTRRPGEGTGLGLSVVYGVVTACGGQVLVDSEVGKGSTFWVYLPRSEAAAKEEVRVELTRSEVHGRILVLDDEQMILDILCERLAGCGFEVSGFFDSQEALQAIQGDPAGFDLVITDQCMPRTTGLELAKAIHRLRDDMPVLLMTGFSEAVTDQALEESRIGKVLMKPLNFADLVNSIQQILAGS